MDKTYYLGIDVGGTKCAVLAGTEDMELLDRIQFATETDRGPDFAITNLLENNAVHKKFKNNKKKGIKCPKI